MPMAIPNVPFGRAWLSEWSLDPAITYLNHGTVGVAPNRVIAAQRAIQDEIERNPASFMLRRLSAIRVGVDETGPGLLRQAAARAGAFVGASADHLVFVDNATAGANVVMRGVDLREGDEVVVTDLGYGGVLTPAESIARERGARVIRVEMPYPIRGVADPIGAIEQAITSRTRLVFVDHVTAETALVLPLAEIAARCHARGALVLADGAHAPGGIALDIESIGVDFYTANLHKWAWAPRSCGVLWAAPAHQRLLHPPVVSWGLGKGFTTEFDWMGTRDPSPWLAAPAAIEMLEAIGADRIRSHNHALAWDAGALLAKRWGTTIDVPESMIGCMIAVPLPPALGSTATDAARLRDALLFDDRIEVQVHAWHGRLWTRISAQIYNDMTDVERLAGAIDRRLS